VKRGDRLLVFPWFEYDRGDDRVLQSSLRCRHHVMGQPASLEGDSIIPSEISLWVDEFGLFVRVFILGSTESDHLAFAFGQQLPEVFVSLESAYRSLRRRLLGLRQKGREGRSSNRWRIGV
jgi:hypothetical protein